MVLPQKTNKQECGSSHTCDGKMTLMLLIIAVHFILDGSHQRKMSRGLTFFLFNFFSLIQQSKDWKSCDQKHENYVLATNIDPNSNNTEVEKTCHPNSKPTERKNNCIYIYIYIPINCLGFLSHFSRKEYRGGKFWKCVLLLLLLPKPSLSFDTFIYDLKTIRKRISD